MAVVFKLFHTVAYFPTQGTLTTYFGEHNLIFVAKIKKSSLEICLQFLNFCPKNIVISKKKKGLHLEVAYNFLIIMTSLYKSHIAFILIYALWPTENSIMAHWLKTSLMGFVDLEKAFNKFP